MYLRYKILYCVFKYFFDLYLKLNPIHLKSQRSLLLFFSSEPDLLKQHTSTGLEFINFLNDKNKSFSCLNNYLKIKILFIKYNTSLIASAAVERLFPFDRIIHSPCRSSMSDDTFKKLVILKGNQDFFLNMEYKQNLNI
ncbi:hypothetical protein QTP88_019489 [Uroleucon formosanum]